MSLIDEAIVAGKIHPNSRARWEASLAENPARTRKLIASLAAVPPELMGPFTVGHLRGPIGSDRGRPATPHPAGGYVVERS